MLQIVENPAAGEKYVVIRVIQNLRKIPGEFPGAVGQKIDDAVVAVFQKIAIDLFFFCVGPDVVDSWKGIFRVVEGNRVDPVFPFFRQTRQKILTHCAGGAEN